MRYPWAAGWVWAGLRARSLLWLSAGSSKPAAQYQPFACQKAQASAGLP